MNDWKKEFNLLWQEIYNRDFLLRDWEDAGRDIESFISSKISEAVEEDRERIKQKLIQEFTDGWGDDPQEIVQEIKRIIDALKEQKG